MPRSVTHESHLKRCATEVGRFYEDIAALQPKLAAVLVQLPPSLEFNGRIVRTFFNSVSRLRGTQVVCEPRHPSWFTSAVESALRDVERRPKQPRPGVYSTARRAMQPGTMRCNSWRRCDAGRTIDAEAVRLVAQWGRARLPKNGNTPRSCIRAQTMLFVLQPSTQAPG
jgi:hypothetical protein